MSDPKPLSPAETMRAVLDAKREDAVDEVMALPPAAVDEALRAAGVDPDEAERRATAAIEAALAAFPETAAPAPSNVVPLRKSPARAKASRWLVAGPLAAAAAVLLALGIANRAAVVAFLRGEEPIGPDTYPPSSVATSTEPTPAEKAAVLRTQAFEALRQKDWNACLAWLDEAAELDPAGDAAPEVVAARAAATKGEAEQRDKPRAPR